MVLDVIGFFHDDVQRVRPCKDKGVDIDYLIYLPHIIMKVRIHLVFGEEQQPVVGMMKIMWRNFENKQ